MHHTFDEKRKVLNELLESLWNIQKALYYYFHFVILDVLKTGLDIDSKSKNQCIN